MFPRLGRSGNFNKKVHVKNTYSKYIGEEFIKFTNYILSTNNTK